MENLTHLQNSLSETATLRLLSAARWARIYGLILCVFSGLGIAMLLISLTAVASFATMMGGREIGLIYLGFVLYLVMLAFMLYLNFQLVIFGRDIKTAINAGDDQYMENGFARLTRYFKIISILMISFVVVGIILGVAMALIGGMGALTAPETPVYPQNHF